MAEIIITNENITNRTCPLPLIIENNNNTIQFIGDMKGVSEFQIDYLIQTWETFWYNNIEGEVTWATKGEGPKGFYKARLWPPLIVVFVFAISLILSSRTILNQSGFKLDCSHICAGFLWAHLCSWFLVWITSSQSVQRVMTRSDGLDTYVVFGLKRKIKSGPFLTSNMPCSISSSVSSRGSTLNKIMIGASYSIGISLFIKFYSDDLWVAISFLLITATGIYENNVYDIMSKRKMLNVGPNVIRLDRNNGHLSPNHQLNRSNYRIRNESNRKVVVPDDFNPSDYNHNSNSLYNAIHTLGVAGFLGSATIKLYMDHKNQYPILFYLCWASGVLFVLLNYGLQNSSLFNRPGGNIDDIGLVNEDDMMRAWAEGSNSKNVNKILGMTCILLELSSLVLGTYAGIMSD